MKAARNFVYGDEEDRHNYVVGDEIPDDIVEDLPSHLILEKVARSNPNSLTREQLLVMAGLDEDEDTEEEFNEEEFMEGLRDFNNKDDLIEWANDIFDLELSRSDGTREQLEEIVLAAAQGTDEEE